jgi:uncharacterized protein (TIGR03067 family)
MTRVKALLLICIMTASLFVSGGCESKSGESEINEKVTELEGTWIGTETGGRDGQWIIIVTEDRIDVNGPGKEDYKGTFTLNTNVSPNQMDFAITECSMDEYVGTTALGIYKVEGDKLTMAATEPGTTIRPALFDGSGDARVFVCTRQ